MNDTSKMTELLSRLRKEMNGAVSEAMDKAGIHYPLNYGVSIPTIRSIAAPYGPDHEFARLLYRQQIRELQLAALYIADPKLLTDDKESEFWYDGIINMELAENAASFLFSKHDAAVNKAVNRLNADKTEPTLGYCDLITLAKALDNGADIDTDTLKNIVSRYENHSEAMLRRGAEVLGVRVSDE